MWIDLDDFWIHSEYCLILLVVNVTREVYIDEYCYDGYGSEGISRIKICIWWMSSVVSDPGWSTTSDDSNQVLVICWSLHFKPLVKLNFEWLVDQAVAICMYELNCCSYAESVDWWYWNLCCWILEFYRNMFFLHRIVGEIVGWIGCLLCLCVWFA